METMLVTQALDERDLLVKKINQKIAKATFVGVAKENSDKLSGSNVTKQEFSDTAKSEFQSVNDLLDRFIRIDAAISASNAITEIETARGKMTVASAISFRGRMRGMGSYAASDFEQQLIRKLRSDWESNTVKMEQQNARLQESAEGMRLSILGKDAKVKNDRPLDVVDAYVKENTTSLIDPLKAKEVADGLSDNLESLLKEIDTKIKVSNATTLVEF